MRCPKDARPDSRDSATETVTLKTESSVSGTASHPVSLPADVFVKGAVIGQYELIRKLGQGGMGSVFLARDTRLARKVAIKFLTTDKPSSTERFVAEARVTARCRHEHIIEIYDVGEAHGCPFMVLEYVRGITLRDWMTQRWEATGEHTTTSGADGGAGQSPISPALAIKIIRPVVLALAHAHGLGLVHRDLKPSNIMLADNGAVKVLDFGIAKILDVVGFYQDDLEIEPSAGQAVENAESGSGSEGVAASPWSRKGVVQDKSGVIGTMAYMSPEQCGPKSAQRARRDRR